jgi:hypothetical protein
MILDTVRRGSAIVRSRGDSHSSIFDQKAGIALTGGLLSRSLSRGTITGWILDRVLDLIEHVSQSQADTCSSSVLLHTPCTHVTAFEHFQTYIYFFWLCWLAQQNLSTMHKCQSSHCFVLS